jgi:hypothetical protein
MSSHRLYKLFSCHASSPFGVLSCVRPLIVSAFRLNSRDYLRDRSTTKSSENTFNLSSIRFEPLSEALRSKARQPSVSINVHNLTTTDLGRHISGHEVESPCNNQKTVCSKHLLTTPRLTDAFCCRIQISSLFKGSVDCRNPARSLLLLARSWSNSESGRGSG